MRSYAGLAGVVLLAAAGALCSPSARAQESTPALGEILDRMDQAQQPNPEPHRPYIVTREYKLLRDQHQQPISTVTAEISSIFPGETKYEIKRVSGSRIGKKIVGKILAWETKSVKDNIAISRHNYDFGFLREENLDGHPTYVLRILAKRKQKSLFNGEVWVDADTFRVRRVEGRLAKKPSWWVRQHHIVLQFADVKGIWIHTSTKATAIVRIFGEYVLIAQEVDLTFPSTALSDRSRAIDAEVALIVCLPSTTRN